MMQEKKLSTEFAIHLCKYLGVGLLSGSMVHAATLGGSSTKYIGLVIAGLLLMLLGNYLEYRAAHAHSHKMNVQWVLLSIALALGTGMLSGSIQHYFDEPKVGAALFSAGLLLAFFAFAFKDYVMQLSLKKTLLVLLMSGVSWIVLAKVVPPFIPASFSAGGGHHHGGGAGEAHTERSNNGHEQLQTEQKPASVVETHIEPLHDNDAKHDHSKHKH